MNRNCLSYWFPLVQSTGVRVPDTRIVSAPPELRNIVLCEGRDDDPPIPDLNAFTADMHAAIGEIGLPCFIRTGQTSAKHSWERTCYLTDASKLMDHVFQIVEFSECCDFMGLPVDVWAVRRLIKTRPLFTAFGGFPVTREFRCFVDDGKLQCVHPYWPQGSIEGRTKAEGWESKLSAASEINPSEIEGIVERAGNALHGAWSIDVLEDFNGEWWVTDCADAGCSFHWEGCKNANRWERKPFEGE